ncbi:THAP domain-containing protein 1-like [Aphis craccivora]|uniref:THAP domain-containing protein 1-like n=1 Tax=Aphis craccivora TaxID=307492 RepID=A0A6G0YKN6_APHCR|nr:THAP domain-containing protein 1-like [Aphis craccivora]
MSARAVKNSCAAHVYYAKKYRQQFPELGCTTTVSNKFNIGEHDYLLPLLIDYLSYGGLIVPSYNFKAHIFRAERIFKKITKQKIPKGTGVVKQLLNKIMNRMSIEEKYRPVLHTFVKQRIFIRMKYANKHQQTLAAKRKASLQLKKLQKLRKL